MRQQETRRLEGLSHHTQAAHDDLFKWVDAEVARLAASAEAEADVEMEDSWEEAVGAEGEHSRPSPR